MDHILSLAGWYFLPGMATNYIQPALYAIFIRAGDPKPQPGSSRFANDRRRIQIAVILFYLLYTIYDADHQLQKGGNFYQALGVALDVDEKRLQSRFRRLTVQFHPDKVSSAIEKEAMERIYVQLKVARDILVDPAKRFAYDRLGAEILTFGAASKEFSNTTLAVRNLLIPGAQRITAFYIGSGGLLLLMSVLGYLKDGKFWRYLIMAMMFVVEMHVLTRPTFPWVLNLANMILSRTGLREPYLPFQMLVLLRKVVVTFFIALAQLSPLFADPRQQGLPKAKVPEALMQQVDLLTRQTIDELGRLNGLEVAPFLGDASNSTEGGLRILKETSKEWLVQNTLRNDPGVKEAVTAVLAQRAEEGHTMN